MTRTLIVSGLLLGLAGCTRRPPAVPNATLANSDAVTVLRAEDSPYHIIYNPPVDLAKKPTSGPASPRRE